MSSASPPKRSILITGCSLGGLGSALALAFHARGYRVFATARNPSKLAHFAALGIETLTLDVLSPSSIADCVSAVHQLLPPNTGLDALLNNSGGGYTMPVADASLAESRKLFDLNVWAVLEVTQAFLPLLLESAKRSGGKGGSRTMIINQSSVLSQFPSPYFGIYNASKAALSMLSDNLRIELSPFSISVVDLKTGLVTSNFLENQTGGAQPVLPPGSIYSPARAELEKKMRSEEAVEAALDSEKYAAGVVADLLKGASPPARVWRGGKAWLVWFVRTFLPHTFVDRELVKSGGFDVLREALRRQAQAEAEGKGKGGSLGTVEE